MSEPMFNKVPPAAGTARGVLLGMLLCVGLLIASMGLSIALGGDRPWMFPWVNGCLLFAGATALRKINESVYARGVLIPLSLVFVLNVLYIVKMSR